VSSVEVSSVEAFYKPTSCGNPIDSSRGHPICGQRDICHILAL